jgi:hypothetical protein
MSGIQNGGYTTQNQLLLNNLVDFYKKNNNLEKILPIINGTSAISIRIIDWFVTNYAKKNFTVYNIPYISSNGTESIRRFKVHIDYKLKLKAYSKKRFDPFCRWDRITIPYKENMHIQTTLGQLNFFKWALENNIIEHIKENFTTIENDMNYRNSSSRKRSLKKDNMNTNTTSGNQDGFGTGTGTRTRTGTGIGTGTGTGIESGTNVLQLSNTKTRKKREELSISAVKCIKKEDVEIIVRFD